MRKSIFAVAMILFPLSVFANGLEISETEYGSKWPFTVSKGTLECRGIKEVVFVNEGKAYAINGKASSKVKRGIYRSLFEIWKPNPDIPGTKIPVTDVLQQGLRLCK